MTGPVRFDETHAKIQDGLARLKEAAARLGASPEQIERASAAFLADFQTTPERELAAMGPDDAPKAPLGDVMAGIGTGAAALLGGVPGGQQLVAGLRSLAPNVSYADARNDVAQSVGMLPAAARVGASMAGGALTGGALANAAKGLPAASRAASIIRTPARQAALYDAAMEATNPNEMSGGERLARTGGAAVVGGLMGKLLDATGKSIGTMRAPTPDAQVLAREAERAASATPLYDAAMRQGAVMTDDAAQRVQDFLATPDVQPFVERLAASREFRTTPPTDPRFLHRLYTLMSERAGELKNALTGPTPTKGSSRALDLADVRTLQEEFLNVLDDAMPAYRDAVKDYAGNSSLIDATKRGVQGVRSALRSGTPVKQTGRGGIEAAKNWVQNAPPDVQAAFLEGATGEGGRLARSGAVPKGALDIAVFPVVRRTYRPLAAAEQFRRAAGVNPSGVDPRVTPSLLAMLMEAVGR